MTGCLLEKGSIFHLLSTDDDISSPKKLECKVENLRDMKLEVIQPKIKNKSELPVGEQTIPDYSVDRTFKRFFAVSVGFSSVVRYSVIETARR